MAIGILGADGSSVAGVGAGHKALRTSLRPGEYSGGVYMLAAETGTMAAGLAANSEIFQLRYTGSGLLLVTLVRANAGSIVAFAAGFCKFDLHVARAWSVDGSGGTALTVTGDNQKMRQVMPSALSGLVTARIASTAALTAGTKTLDANPHGKLIGGVTATAGATLFGASDELFNAETMGEYPIALANQEGIVIRATVPATGTWTGGVMLKCVEVSTAEWGSV